MTLKASFYFPYISFSFEHDNSKIKQIRMNKKDTMFCNVFARFLLFIWTYLFYNDWQTSSFIYVVLNVHKMTSSTRFLQITNCIYFSVLLPQMYHSSWCSKKVNATVFARHYFLRCICLEYHRVNYSCPQRKCVYT